jgi:hypothetical protein
MDDRDNKAFEVRKDAAQLAKERRGSPHPINGEEEEYENKNYIANYSKGLEHDDDTGEVDPIEYKKLLKALRTGKQEDFNKIKLPFSDTNEAVPLTNPQAGFAFDLEGPDSLDLGIREAPRIDEPEAAGEMAELYWMALCRDVPFMEFNSNNLIAEAVSDLSSNSNYNDYPHKEVGFLTNLGDDIGDRIFSKKFEIPPNNQTITTNTIFRGITDGDIMGPYVSQFLWMDVPWGAQRLEQIQHPLELYDINNTKQGQDYLTDYNTWLDIQEGRKIDGNDFNKDDVDTNFKRHIITGRDITYYVHVDQLYQAYLHACIILSAPKRLGGLEVKVDPLLPYQDKNEYPNEMGFATFREPHILTLVTEVATRALKAVWYQKWRVNRRLRPEELGGRIHRKLNNGAPYNIHEDITNKINNNQILAKIKEHNKNQNINFPNRMDQQGTYLLPQAFREGSPTHPSYGSGHATVAGACVTILKAWFKEDEVIANPVEPVVLNNPIEIRDGNNQILYRKTTELRPYTGSDQLTVGGELNKIAANIAIGRSWSGVHYRSDYAEAILLGEQIALGILQEQAETYNEKFACELTRFNGKKIRFNGKRIINVD